MSWSPRSLSAPALPRTAWLAPALVGVACNGAPELEGKVIDPWEHGIEDATVIVEGVAEQMVTDTEGSFNVDALDGKMTFLAGKDGYIKGTTQIRVPRGDDVVLPVPEIVLYPDPEEPGFYAVDDLGYARLEAQSVRSVGTELKSFTGLPDLGTAVLPREKPLRLVLATTRRKEEIARLDLQLAHLNFVDHQALKDVTSDTMVTVNLYVADESVPFDVVQLSSNDYLITSRGPLPPGPYAFHIQSVLTDPDVHHLEKLPREMRLAYPFEIEPE